jgi:DNA-directed RNA polymerase omega subunit
MEQYQPNVDSKFKLINVAAKRCRELRSGARARIHISSKNTARIALEEVKSGAVRYETLPSPTKKTVDEGEGTPIAV